MKEFEERVLVLYDKEEEYARLMSEFLRTHSDAPWEIRTYTKEADLLAGEGQADIGMLVVAESVYSEKLDVLGADRTVILNESGVMKWGQLPNINKYQQADNVVRGLLEIYMEIARVALPKLQGGYRTNFIGIYSPVHKSMQSSIALTMCQMMAKDHRTLYLNFEHYQGISELVPDRQSRDMADLLYFLAADSNRFRLRMQTMIQKRGCLEYIPSMKSGQNLLTVTAKEWLELLQKIEELGEYEYVVLDLSESMQGLFEILRICRRVFTFTQEDKISKCKLMQYEQLLSWYDYEDVLQKTSRHGVPKIHRFPTDLEHYTKGELADFVKGLVEELWNIQN